MKANLIGVIFGVLTLMTPTLMTAKAQAESLPQIQAEMERLNSEIRALKGELEVAFHEIKLLKKKLAPQASHPGSPPLAQAPQGSSDPSLPHGSAQERYDYARQLLDKGDYDSAHHAFQNFLEIHPSHSLAINAHYWIGEITYNQNNYPDAAKAFAGAYEMFMKSKSDAPQFRSKIPEILIKLADCLARQKKFKNAEVILKKLENDFSVLPSNLKSLFEKTKQGIQNKRMSSAPSTPLPPIKMNT